MNFSDALYAVKAGKKISRTDWNGKGQFVVYQRAYPDGIPVNKNTSDALGIPVGTIRKFLPYLLISTVGGCLVPWLASQGDLLAEDWLAE